MRLKKTHGPLLAQGSVPIYPSQHQELFRERLSCSRAALWLGPSSHHWFPPSYWVKYSSSQNKHFFLSLAPGMAMTWEYGHKLWNTRMDGYSSFRRARLPFVFHKALFFFHLCLGYESLLSVETYRWCRLSKGVGKVSFWGTQPHDSANVRSSTHERLWNGERRRVE